MSIDVTLAESGASPLTARALILSIVDSSERADLSVAYLIAAARLFDIEPSAVRVGLARLVKHGVLEQVERGRYRIGPRGRPMHDTLRGWADVESRLVPWDGAWLAAQVGHLRRTDRTRVRSRERALGLRGFAALGNGMWVRPANFAASLGALRAELIDLGLDAAASLYRIVAAEPADAIRAERLWDRHALEAGYRTRIAELRESLGRVNARGAAAAAREMLLLGRAVTRDILIDPLLPDALVDAPLRRALIAEMTAYNRAALRRWAAFAAESGA